MGHIDLFHSRRTNFNKCEYWIRDERDDSGPASQWILYNQSSGRFYAKAVSIRTNQINMLNNAWAIDSNHITLETDDDVDNLIRGSIVKYNDELRLVENTQREIHHKESEFAKNLHYKTLIALARS